MVRLRHLLREKPNDPVEAALRIADRSALTAVVWKPMDP